MLFSFIWLNITCEGIYVLSESHESNYDIDSLLSVYLYRQTDLMTYYNYIQVDTGGSYISSTRDYRSDLRSSTNSNRLYP